MREKIANGLLTIGKWASLISIFLFIFLIISNDYSGLLSSVMDTINEHFFGYDEDRSYFILWIAIMIIVISADLLAFLGTILKIRGWGIKKISLLLSIPSSFLLPYLIVTILVYPPFLSRSEAAFFPLFFIEGFFVGVGLSFPALVWVFLNDDPTVIKQHREWSMIKFPLFLSLFIIISFLPDFFWEEIDIGEEHNTAFISFILSVFLVRYLVDILIDINQKKIEKEGSKIGEGSLLKLPLAGIVLIIIGTIILSMSILYIIPTWEYEFIADGLLFFFPAVWLGYLTWKISIPAYRRLKYELNQRRENDKRIKELDDKIKRGRLKLERVLGYDEFIRHHNSIISVFLALVALGSIEISLRYSILTSDWYSFNVDYLLWVGLGIIFLFLLPRTILRSFILDDKLRRKIIRPAILIIILIYLFLLVSGYIGYNVRDESYGDIFVYLGNERSLWMITAVIPNFCLLISLYLIKPSKKIILISTVLVVISTAAIIAWNHILVNSIEGGDENFITNYSSVLFTLIPALYSIMIPLLFKVGRSGQKDEPVKVLQIIGKKVKRVFVSIGPILSIFFVFVLVIAMCDSYDSWHSYRYIENIDEEEWDYIDECLSRDIPGLMNESLYQRDRFMDPNFITNETIKDFKKWIQEKDDGDKWGSYYAEVGAELHYHSNISINKTVVDQGYETYDEAEIDIDFLERPVFLIEDDYCIGLGYVFDGVDQYFFNGSGFRGRWRGSNVSIELNDLTVISTYLRYGEQVAPLAGYGGNVEQSVGIKNNEIVFVYSLIDQWVSAILRYFSIGYTITNRVPIKSIGSRN